MRGAVDAAAPAEQWALIRAHPQLGTRGRSPAPLTEASTREQRRAGLDACTAEQWASLDRLNAAYVAKFAMPFILAVRGHDPNSIIEQVERRLGNDPPTEQRTALREIGLIAGYRLAAAIASPPGAEILAMRSRLLRDAGEAGARLREWMLAADLQVMGAGRGLAGYRYSGRPDAPTVALGVHHASHARALRYDGRLGLLTGMAWVQQLQETDRRLPFDLCVIAPPDDVDVGDGAILADADELSGCVTLEAAAGAAADAEASECLAALRAAGMGPRGLVTVRQGGAGIFYRAAATREFGAADAPALDSAVRVLEEFLVQRHDA